MEASVVGNIRRFEDMEQAALAKAFRGELVTQDATDEPASVLLDRIRAARAEELGQPRRGRGPRGDDGPTVEEDNSIASGGQTTNGAHDPSLDLVAASFQADGRLTATAIAEATGLDAAAVKAAIKALVDAGQVRVHGRARGTTYEWTA